MCFGEGDHPPFSRFSSIIARRSGIFYLDSFENLIMNNDNAVYADLLVRRMKERGVFDTLTASIEAEVMSVRSVVSHAFSLLG